MSMQDGAGASGRSATKTVPKMVSESKAATKEEKDFPLLVKGQVGTLELLAQYGY